MQIIIKLLSYKFYNRPVPFLCDPCILLSSLLPDALVVFFPFV